MGFGGVGVRKLQVMDEVVRHVQRVHGSFQAAGDVTTPLLLGDLRAGASRARALARARGDAATAERLLDPVLATEPGLAMLADAIRSARVVQGMRPIGAHAVTQVRDDLARELQAVDAWRGVHSLDRSAREAALVRLRGMEPDELAAEDWRTLAGILGDDVDGELTAGLPRSLGSGLSMRDLALNLANRGGAHLTIGNRNALAHQYFDAWKASTIDLDTRLARIDELLSGDPRRMQPGEWRELTALLRAGGHDIVEHPWFPGVRVDFATRHAMLGGYDEVRALAPSHLSASDAQLDAARSQLLAPGELGDLARALVQQGRLERVGIEGAEASAARLRHLVPDSVPSARAWLDDVRVALEAVEPSGPTGELRRSALELVDRNLARIEGDRWWRPRDGYANHPDYAELGRVRSTWQLLEQLAPGPAPSPAMPAAPVAPGSLTW